MIWQMSSENESWKRWRYGPPFGPIVGTLVALIAWLVFILLYALYWSKSFDLFQNVIVTIATLMIVGLLIGLMWMVWIRMRGPMRKWRDMHDQTKNEGSSSQK
jgi:hypothetical protein